MQDRAQQLFEPLARAKSAGDPSRAFPKLSLALVAAGPQDRIEGEVRRAAAPATPAHVVRMRLAEASTGIDRFPNKITNLAGVADSRPPRCSTNVSTRRRVQQRRWPRFPYVLGYGRHSGAAGAARRRPRRRAGAVLRSADRVRQGLHPRPEPRSTTPRSQGGRLRAGV